MFKAHFFLFNQKHRKNVERQSNKKKQQQREIMCKEFSVTNIDAFFFCFMLRNYLHVICVKGISGVHKSTASK